jgi:glycosyltransferase involved in cell wall biosynthesis
MDLVVPAFAKIKAKHPSSTLIVVGDGTLKDKMQLQAEEFNCSQAITWTGRQPQQLLSKWYRSMDVVLMPSRSEGFGLTAIEAMAQGCVVVASNVGGLPEVVKDGKVGLLHKPEDVIDIADKVNLLIENPKRWSELSRTAIDYVQRFSMSAFQKLITDLYSKI